ncbi:MAG: tol-pal system protein YbgF [Burkholderiaceae bacterium]|nr:tol-pal system protein YbgF [Burkholderiaceae bacterium]
MGLTLALAGGGAQAGLFDDEEARKAILDLRARIQAGDEANRARVADLAKSSGEQADQLRRSLLDLNAQLETQRADNAKLRGAIEQLTRDLAELQRSTKAIDDRLRPLEPQKVSLDGREFVAEADERRAYDQALATLRSGDFDKASALLGAFVQRYPGSGYGESARFWLGNALYGQKNYKDAVAVFRALVTGSPNHPRTPEAMLAMANCQIEMKDARAARKTIDDLVKAYPASEAAAAGKERLGSLKG